MSFISPLARVTTVVVAGIFFFVITRLSSSFQQEKVIEINPQQPYVEPSNVIPRYTQFSGDSIQDALAFVRDLRITRNDIRWFNIGLLRIDLNHFFLLERGAQPCNDKEKDPGNDDGCNSR
jgi:hypothetical protein